MCKLQLNLRVRVKYHKAEQIDLLNREGCLRKWIVTGDLTQTKRGNASRLSSNVYLLLINLKINFASNRDILRESVSVYEP